MSGPRVYSRVFTVILVIGAAAAIVSCDDGTDQSEVPAASAIRTDPQLPMPAGFIVGYVRDVNGWAVPGARVRLTGGGRSVRASRSGRFKLPAGPGRHTLAAVHPSYTRQSVA